MAPRADLSSKAWRVCNPKLVNIRDPIFIADADAKMIWEAPAPTSGETDVLLGALNLIDVALVAGLIVMVMLSGYENFVSRLDVTEAEKAISWLGKLDAGTLKLKVAAYIVAISAIQLLKGYMDVAAIPNDKLLWMTVIHLTFVVSALLLAIMDRLMGAGHPRL